MIIIAAFILGVVYTLIIFHLNIAVLSTFPIDVSLIIELFVAIGTISAVFVALFKEPILEKWFGYRPELKIIDSLENIQGRQGCTRIRFENKGKITASDAEVYVSNIYDDNKPRNDFIPVPLYWAHVGISKRDFHPNQYGFLDFCRINHIFKGKDLDGNERYYAQDDPKLTIQAGAQIATYEDIYQNTNAVELTIFQKFGIVEKVKVHIEWNHLDPMVKIKKTETIK